MLYGSGQRSQASRSQTLTPSSSGAVTGKLSAAGDKSSAKNKQGKVSTSKAKTEVKSGRTKEFWGLDQLAKERTHLLGLKKQWYIDNAGTANLRFPHMGIGPY